MALRVTSLPHSPQLCHIRCEPEKTRKKKITFVVRSFIVQPYSSSSSSSAALCYQHFICWCCVCHSCTAGGGVGVGWGEVRNVAAKKLFATPPTHITRRVFHYLKGPSVCQDALHTLRRNALAQFALVSSPLRENTLCMCEIKLWSGTFQPIEVFIIIKMTRWYINLTEGDCLTFTQMTAGRSYDIWIVQT